MNSVRPWRPADEDLQGLTAMLMLRVLKVPHEGHRSLGHVLFVLPLSWVSHQSNRRATPLALWISNMNNWTLVWDRYRVSLYSAWSLKSRTLGSWARAPPFGGLIMEPWRFVAYLWTNECVHTIIHPTMSPMKFLAKGTAFGRTGIVDKTTAFLFEDKIYEQVGSSLKQFPLKFLLSPTPSSLQRASRLRELDWCLNAYESLITVPAILAKSSIHEWISREDFYSLVLTDWGIFHILREHRWEGLGGLAVGCFDIITLANCMGGRGGESSDDQILLCNIRTHPSEEAIDQPY